MCVVIFSGKREQAIMETGMDMFADQEGNVRDEDFVNKNKGQGKRYPGGPTCVFQGKEIPCLTRWSEKGSITAEILVEILATLDHYGVMDRSEGRRPFLLLDGHGSRFGINFLKYINDASHEWSVCIGVPYGTSLWQVGDSSEQNGSYKIGLARAKQDLIDKKKVKQMIPTIYPYKIIPLINTAWAQSFARPSSNKKAIAERGWYPLNRNLLLNNTLRTTMTKSDKEIEIPRALFPETVSLQTTPFVPHASNTALTTIDSNECSTLASTTTTTTTLIIREPHEKLNYSDGRAAMCLDSIVSHGDLMKARERIRRERSEGKTITERMQEQKGHITAGKLFNSGLCRISKTVFDIVNKNKENIKKAAEEKGKAARIALQEKITKANAVRALGIERDKLTNAQLKTLLAPFKREGDAAIPTKKADLLRRLVEWEARGAIAVEEEVALVVAEVTNEMITEDKHAKEGEKTDKFGIIEEV